MRDDTTRSRSAAADRPDDDTSPTTDSLFGEAALSEAAREAVRSPADPRLDPFLARMGLADAPETGTSASAATVESVEPPAPPTRPEPVAAAATIPEVEPDPAIDARQAALASELERLRSTLAAQETTVAEVRDRMRSLGMLAGGGLVVAVIALLLALIR